MASSPIPTAQGLPLVGNVFALLRDMRAFVTDRYLELGPVYRVRVMNRRFTVLAGPEANRFVQRDGASHLRSYEYWSRFNSRFGAARSVLSTENAEHKVFRDVFRRAYSRPLVVRSLISPAAPLSGPRGQHESLLSQHQCRHHQAVSTPRHGVRPQIHDLAAEGCGAHQWRRGGCTNAPGRHCDRCSTASGHKWATLAATGRERQLENPHDIEQPTLRNQAQPTVRRDPLVLARADRNGPRRARRRHCRLRGSFR